MRRTQTTGYKKKIARQDMWDYRTQEADESEEDSMRRTCMSLTL